ncbi:MAG: hypothetical protein IJH32_08960 [Ruminococcus sp.]|nr:hypothetical protein [Ruminococcus sp.]
MKKNKIMRIASVLLIVTLLSTCAISGTFAKYVTTGEAEGTARVAKWGIVVTVDGDLAAKEYKADDTTYNPVGGPNASAGLSVKANEVVVAPGTGSKLVNGEWTNCIEASIEGKPEVATRFALYMTADDFTEICLPAGTYTDENGDDFTVAEDYYPVKLTLTVERDGRQVGPFTGTAQDILDALDAIGGNDNLTADFAPGVNCNATFRLTWEWPFEGARDGFTAEEIDKMDTYLGNAIAGVVDDTGVTTIESFGCTASATQID